MSSIKVPRTEDFAAFVGLEWEMMRKEIRRRATGEIFWSYQPTKNAAPQIYGQEISLANALTLVEGIGAEDGWKHNNFATEQIHTMSRTLRGQCRQVDASSFTLSKDIIMPVRPTLLFRCSLKSHHLLWIQPTKGWPIRMEGLQAVKKILRIAYDGTDYEATDCRVIDLGSLDGKERSVRSMHLSGIDELSDREFRRQQDEILEALHSVANELAMPIAEPRATKRLEPPLLRAMRGNDA